MAINFNRKRVINIKYKRLQPVTKLTSENIKFLLSQGYRLRGNE